jgi:hypothetical protein
MRKVVTYIECDRCDFNQIIECSKGLFGFKIAPYPEDWKIVENDALCAKCKKQWYETYKNFMSKSVTKKKEVNK